jgi:hypothetical protein
MQSLVACLQIGLRAGVKRLGMLPNLRRRSRPIMLDTSGVQDFEGCIFGRMSPRPTSMARRCIC